MAAKKGGLGKGLAALIPAVPAGGATATEEPEVSRETDKVRPAPEPRSGSTDVDGPAASAVEAEATDAIDIDDFDVDDIETDYVEPTVSRETETENAPEEQQEDALVPVPGATFRLVPLDEITMNPRQPRQVFDEDELGELKTSLAEVGLLQPIAVRELDSGYELILGERRTRAARELGWEAIPALVRETRDDELLRDALLENIHRVQLNPLEEGAAYQQLLDEFGVTQEELSKRIGRSRPQISNTIRLLSLPGSVQRRVAAGVLSAGHARAILSLGQEERQDAVATRIVAEGLSVRATEELVSLELAENRDGESEDVSRETGGSKRAAKLQAPGLADLADRLSEHFDTRVKVSLGHKKGRIVIEFGSVADLERIAESMGIDSTPEQSDQL